MQEIYQIIEYEFKDEVLLKRALTHSSMGKESYERLEFLGDAVLGLIVAESLYKKFPQEKEGRLSRMRAALVNRDALAKVSLLTKLNQFVVLGEGERKAGGSERPSILADAIEAIIGAIYLDGGIEVCRAFINKWFGKEINKVHDLPTVKDPKSTLQEWAQKQKLPLPDYEVVATAGKAHNQVFRVSCKVRGHDGETHGEARSRKKAEQEAAKNYLDKLAKSVADEH